MVDFENMVQNSMFSNSTDKSFLDKLLGRQDVEKVRKIISKPRLNRQDMMELLNLLSSNETKLLNYGVWDRYIMAKFFVWIREFVALAENLYDYKESLVEKAKTCAICHKRIDDEKDPCRHGKDFEPVFHLSAQSTQIFENNMRLMEHNIKFLVDLYFNLARTTLSLGATAFMEALKNKYEMVYDYKQEQASPQKQAGVNFKWK